VAVIETDKVNVDIRSTAAGTITKYFANEGDTVQVDAEFFELDTEGKSSGAKKVTILVCTYKCNSANFKFSLKLPNLQPKKKRHKKLKRKRKQSKRKMHLLPKKKKRNHLNRQIKSQNPHLNNPRQSLQQHQLRLPKHPLILKDLGQRLECQ
jgi:pyruvate/2-oxoglutarate dehydrogenase complex dihydrolipoamide acyltransferase (E2) component